jgi:hypothetical protein
MSADNYIAIQKRDGKWFVWMDFASNDDPKPKDNVEPFETNAEAIAYAWGWLRGESIVEFGIMRLDEYITPPKDTYDMQNKAINDEADRVRKNMEGSYLYGIPIDRNNVNHLIVAAYHSGMFILDKTK